MKRRVLGIDPGSYHLGIGCIEKEGNRVTLIYAATIHAPKGETLYPRLEFIAKKLGPLITELAPHEIAVENVFFAKNVRSAIQLGMARGVAVAMCLGRDLPIFEYPPTQVKLVVTGYGKADKTQVAKMIRLLLGVRGEWTVGVDATDALAVAICHASHHAGISSRKSSHQEPRDIDVYPRGPRRGL